MLTQLSSLVLMSLLGAGAQSPPAPTPASLEKGKSLYAANCVACHGEKGDGTGPAAVALNPKPRNFATDPFRNGNKPDQVFKTLTEGLAGTAMPPFAHLSESDRWAVVHHVASLMKPAKAPASK